MLHIHDKSFYILTIKGHVNYNEIMLRLALDDRSIKTINLAISACKPLCRLMLGAQLDILDTLYKNEYYKFMYEHFYCDAYGYNADNFIERFNGPLLPYDNKRAIDFVLSTIDKTYTTLLMHNYATSKPILKNDPTQNGLYLKSLYAEFNKSFNKEIVNTGYATFMNKLNKSKREFERLVTGKLDNKLFGEHIVIDKSVTELDFNADYMQKLNEILPKQKVQSVEKIQSVEDEIQLYRDIIDIEYSYESGKPDTPKRDMLITDLKLEYPLKCVLLRNHVQYVSEITDSAMLARMRNVGKVKINKIIKVLYENGFEIPINHKCL